jgi:UDP-glucose 4-epimerase
VLEVISAVERATERKVPWHLAARRPGDPAVLYAAADNAFTELGWTPRFAELDAIVGTAWNWHRTHPAGYRTPSIL